MSDKKSPQTAPAQTPAKKARAPLTPEQQAAKAAERRKRFVELAPKRVSAACKRLRHVANMASKQGYDYTPDEAKKIVAFIGTAYEAMKAAFDGKKDGAGEFSL